MTLDYESGITHLYKQRKYCELIILIRKIERKSDEYISMIKSKHTENLHGKIYQHIFSNYFPDRKNAGL